MIYYKDKCICDPYAATFEQGLNFLVELHENHKEKYSSIAGARSALSALLPLHERQTFGKDPLVTRSLRFMFRLRPVLPTKTVVYDRYIILGYMESLPPNN